MNDAFVVAIDGLPDNMPLEALPKRIQQNAVRAVNYAAKRGRTRAAKEIRQQVNFPASYLYDSAGRLTVQTAKTISDLAEIRGHWRPTSLARFATRGTVGKPGVSLQVKPGKATRSNRMFLIRLRAGTADLETKSNMGLAIRLKPGERVTGKLTTVQMKNGLTLLYGPSISQVFRSVAADETPAVEEDLTREFLRLMEAGV